MQALPYKAQLAGLGLDSTELGWPPSLFKAAFDLARSEGLHCVAHAGELSSHKAPNLALELEWMRCLSSWLRPEVYAAHARASVASHVEVGTRSELVVEVDMPHVERVDHGVHTLDDPVACCSGRSSPDSLPHCLLALSLYCWVAGEGGPPEFGAEVVDTLHVELVNPLCTRCCSGWSSPASL